MTHAPLRSFCASTAICAVLALGSTPAWAQDAAPTPGAPAVSVPAPAVAPQPVAQPTIQLPTTSPAPAAPAATPPRIVSQPIVQSAPVAPPVAATAPEQAAPRAANPARTATRTSPVVASRTTPAVGSAATPADGVSQTTPPQALTPLAPAAVTPPPANTAAREEAPVAPAAVKQSDTPLTPTAEIAALLLALGLGAGGYFALRARRRQREEDVYTPATEAGYASPHPEMAIHQPTGGLVPEAPLPAFATSDDMTGGPAEREFAPAAEMANDARRMIGEEELAPATGHHSAFVMPDGPAPQTREARDALLERMVSAPPDSENPFTSRKGRLRRARLILQRAEFDQKLNATQPFDWRTYKPSTSNPAPATPPRVTA